MSNYSRRSFLYAGSAGLAALGTQGLLSTAAEPTERSGDLGRYGNFLAQVGDTAAAQQVAATRSMPSKVTETNILGPYYRQGAPYRGKITPPLEPGEVLVIRGQVWGHDSKRPLAHAVLDIWQANAKGRYDNDDAQKPPASDFFQNRAQLVANEQGVYEFETIKPGPYQIGEKQWRPSHIHYMVRHPGYQTLVTQLYFQGDPHIASDQFVRKSLIIDLQDLRVPAGLYKTGVFDIVLAPGKGSTPR
jgi:catechol 1,2-dioxygenase